MSGNIWVALLVNSINIVIRDFLYCYCCRCCPCTGTPCENQHFSYTCGNTVFSPTNQEGVGEKTEQEMKRSICAPVNTPSLSPQEDYTTDEEALAAHGVKGGAGGILDLLKASKQVAGLDSATLRYQPPIK